MNNIGLQSEFKNLVINDHYSCFGFKINSIGYKTITPNNYNQKVNEINTYRYLFNKGKVLNEFKLIYITSGMGYVCFENMSETEISKGKVLLFYPHQKYTYYHLSDYEWKEYFIRFETDNDYKLMIRRFFPDNKLIMDIGYNDELLNLFCRAIDVIKNRLKSSQVYLSGILFHILGLVISESKNKTLNKKHLQQIEYAKIIFNENIYTDIKIEDVAERLNLSYSLFRLNFKKITGVSPAKYYTNLKICKAKQLLLETPYSIKEVSFMLSFSTFEYFSTLFKKIVGVSPKDFRIKNSTKKV